jgi:hypothetical protein
LRRPGAVSPRVILAPEDSARPVQPAGFFFAAKPDKGRTGMEGAGGSRRGYRATSWGHPNENPGTMRSTSESRRRRDSGKPAVDSIQAKGCPMAHTAAKRTSESPTAPSPPLYGRATDVRPSSLGATHLATAGTKARRAGSVVVEPKDSAPVKATA